MIILVSGLPGSGKSFFAARLALRIEAEYINSDKVRRELQKSPSYSYGDKLAVYKELLSRVSMCIEQGKDVVVDATFYHHTMREMFLRLAKGYNLPLYVIEVTADEALIRERLKTPRKYSDADFSVYETVRDSFEEITMPHLVLESTNTNIDSMLDTAARYVHAAIDEGHSRY